MGNSDSVSLGSHTGNESVERLIYSQSDRPTLRWQESLKRAIRTPKELLKELQLEEAQVTFSHKGLDDFPLFVTREFVSRMKRGDSQDPLFLQVWPQGAESQVVPGDLKDAVGELGSQAIPGLLHKYQGRVLLIASGACAIHCRYCFRRHFPYDQSPKDLAQWDKAFQHIAADPTIEEVILSGGDPLSLVDTKLQQLIRKIEQIPHVKRLRIHSRLPVVIPSRITTELLEMLRGSRLAVWFVLHINHVNEIDDELGDSIAKLRLAGVSLLNQAVLLRGINDSVPALESLFTKLIDLQVMPYYLHQLDRVEGASHWEVDRERGRAMIRELRARLPGYGVPLYVKEEAAEPHKTPL